jgi:adenine deaminase
MIKESGSIHNTKRIAPLITEKKINSRNLMWNSDHTGPDFLKREGNIDAYIRVAIEAGIDPVTAIQMASINAAEYFGVTDILGSVSPGRVADIVLVDGLDTFRVTDV